MSALATEMETETRTYRGESLQALLPRIREELGPDAVILRRREGIVGGVGGFFGKKCVEVEARPSWEPEGLPRPAIVPQPGPRPAPRRAMPSRAVVDAYDTGGFPGQAQAEQEPRDQDAHDEQDGRHEDDGYDAQRESALIEALIAQASPFAEELSDALADQIYAQDAPTETFAAFEPGYDESAETGGLDRAAVLAAVGPQAPAAAEAAVDETAAATAAGEQPIAVEATPAVAAPVVAVPETRVVRIATTTQSLRTAPDDAIAIGGQLRAAGIPAHLVTEIADEVEHALRPFEPFAPHADLARRALARRIKVSHGWRTPRRTIALVGLPGAGRTLTAAKLCAAYAAAGRSVAALSLESARAATRLAELTVGLDVTFEVAGDAELVARARKQLRRSEIVVVDTPPLAEAVDGEPLDSTLELLAALRPDETHMLLPVGADLAAARAFLMVLASKLEPTHFLLTHDDVQSPSGTPVGLSLAHRARISYVTGGGAVAAGMRAAEPYALARMVVQ